MRKHLTMLSILILVSGCYVQSLNKFFTKDKKVKLDQIIGEWISEKQMGDDVKDKKITPWKFTSKSIETYDEENTYSKLDCVYFKVGNNYFIDFTAGEPKFKTNIYWGAGLTLVHFLCKVKIINDTLVITPLDLEWFTERIKANKLKLSFIKANNKNSNYIITVSSEEWVVFLEKHGNDPEVFNEKYNFIFQRKK